MAELDGEEKEILDAFNEGGLKRSDNFHERIEKHRQFAESVLRKDASTPRKKLRGRLRVD
jgi:hypothetical protein